MDNSLHALCDALKKIISKLKPQNNPLSFVVLTGKNAQGKSALLQQSSFEEVPLLNEEGAKIYFNAQGILLELGEQWFSNRVHLVQNIFKQINRAHPYLKITGLALCIDTNDLLIADRDQFLAQRKSHLQWLERIGHNLGYSVDLNLIFCKMDTLAGFTEFYQSEHASDLAKALGFSLNSLSDIRQRVALFNKQFTHFVETLEQQVIPKIHPARSTMRRSLIREFPLQVANLRPFLQTFIQGVSPKLFRLQALYFTSAEQGGLSIDRLNKKIQHEYALVVQDTFPQATNFRAYFVDGALKSIQSQCSQIPERRRFSQKPFIALTAGIATLGLSILTYHHYHTLQLLDEASKDLLVYDSLNQQKDSEKQALFHLSNATKTITRIASNPLSLPTVHQLKTNLHQNTALRLQNEFYPALMAELEEVLNNPSNGPTTRYEALKVYLMLGQQSPAFSPLTIQEWFKNKWQALSPQKLHNQLSLLNQLLQQAPKPHFIKPQVISDTRNYLNALPTSYLFYSLAKSSFPKEQQKIAAEGFLLAHEEIPLYFTKKGFQEILQKIPNISQNLKQERWVLGRNDFEQLPAILTEAYCFDYVTWWNTFIRKTQPLHYQNYQEGRQLIKKLATSNSINQLVRLIQQETKADLNANNNLFNQSIASQFADLHLMSDSSVNELSIKINELEKFISTLSLIDDGGKTAFNISKSRFINENAADPISALFNQARQMPAPLNQWTQQIASETWGLLIHDSRQYINRQWQQSVYQEFEANIANRYPFDASQREEIALTDFNRFFATHGSLNTFTENYIKPFLDVSNAEWKPKAVNNSIIPISTDTLDALVRANIITNMFFPDSFNDSKIEFSLQKINLDPMVAKLMLQIGQTRLMDNQSSDSLIRFNWPHENAKLSLNSIEGNYYELSETGTWAFFKLLEKVNVLIDEQDSSSLQILFEINSNSGRYLLKTNNQVNPFTPGILNGFTLNKTII